MIDIHRVTAFQQQTKALDNLSLQIAQGERVAILGPNGSGKSTLLKLLTREIYPVEHPDSHIKLFGSRTITLWDLRAQLGMVSQDLQEDYTPYTQALDVVISGFFGAIGTHAHLQPTEQNIKQARVMLEAVGMTSYAQRMFQRLSTGQKRRLLLARALVHEPKALILDEPSAGLDMGASITMLNLLRQFCQQQHSIVIATHHVDEITPEIERVVLLQNGRLLADGPKQDVLTSANLSELYQAELDITTKDGWYRCWHV